jgi:SAM-dependent methyltransferase
MSKSRPGPREALREEILGLGPWFLEVEVADGLTTSVTRELSPDSYPQEWGTPRFNSPGPDFIRSLQAVYPDGLGGRSVLDCACNCGGYLFWAKEAGAGRCVGTDVREHWIRQARFLQERREGPTDDMSFEVCDLYDLPGLGLGKFDLVLLCGVLYHVPDPLLALRIAADLAGDVLLIETATKAGMPDGFLAVGTENPQKLQSGVYGLKWRPTGPQTIVPYLEWLGFPETRLLWWTDEVDPDWGRFQLVASRTPGAFDHIAGQLPPPGHLTAHHHDGADGPAPRPQPRSR